MGTISFSEIPTDLLAPGQFIEIDNTRSNTGQPTIYKRVLMLGQRLSSGHQPANHPQMTVSAADASAMHGRGSMLAAMAAAFFKANSYTELWTVGITDDGGAQQAGWTLTVTGPATQGGQVYLYIGGVRIVVGVDSGDTATDIATAIAAAITAAQANAVDELSYPPVANISHSSGVVKVCAVHAGEAGSYLDIRLNYQRGERLPAGVAIAIADDPDHVGSDNPSISAALTAAGAGRFTHVILPYTDATNFGLVKTWTHDRWAAMVMNEVHVFTAQPGAIADLSDLGDTPNDPTLTIMDISTSPTPPWICASVLGAVDAFESIPNRPRNTLALPGILPPVLADRRTLGQANILLNHGISTFYVDDGGTVRISKLVTTYRTNVQGVPDHSYLAREKMDLLATLRQLRRNRIAAKFPRCRLAENTTKPLPSDIVTPKDIELDCFAQAQEWISLAYMIDDMPAFIAAYRNEIDPNNRNRINELIQPNLVGGLDIYAGLLQFLN